MTTAVATQADPREAALLKAIGFDRLQPEQRELALSIANRYALDPMLKHLVMVEGRPYITRDGLLHVAHRSGQLDGIEVTDAEVVEYLGVKFWRARCSVYRKDMSRPFTYTGRYPTTGGNQKFAPEMAVKVAEVMALRRAFDVAAPVLEERWDSEVGQQVAQASLSATQPSLAERAAARRAEVEQAPLVDRRASTGPSIESDAADVPPAEPTAEPSAPTLFEDSAAPRLTLSKAEFVRRLEEAGIDPQHAGVVRLVMFPDATKDLTAEERGVLWLALEREKAEAEAVPA